ncbi:MAG TPA: DUF2807 domain-containing protein [Sphingomicrobium sp.]|jgi:hypothetical protein|nr:DUF2807 domain-containing protein [Sphingomicrobium sp.]
MNRHLLAAACAAAAVAAPGYAAERHFSVTDFNRVRVDGPYRVKLTTGVSPFATASGSPAAINGVSVEVQGTTLVVRANTSSWGGYPGQSPGPVEINAGTHDLTDVWLNGAGALAIDKAKGLTFGVSVQGPGSVTIDKLAVDRLDAGLSGSGSAVLGGKAAQVTAIARGTATFDGTNLIAKDATIGAEGTSVVKLNATGTAKVDTRGTSTVVLGGGPACTVKAAGSATVSGCD